MQTVHEQARSLAKVQLSGCGLNENLKGGVGRPRMRTRIHQWVKSLAKVRLWCQRLEWNLRKATSRQDVRRLVLAGHPLIHYLSSRESASPEERLVHYSLG